MPEEKYLLVIVIFYKFLEFFNVTDRLQILLHMGKCCEMICGVFKQTNKQKPLTIMSFKIIIFSVFFFPGSYATFMETEFEPP